jgi:hypothetical protein
MPSGNAIPWITMKMPQITAQTFFFLELGLEFRTYTLNHYTSPFLCLVFSRQGLMTYLHGWLWNLFLLISASWVARITDLSHIAQLSTQSYSIKSHQLVTSACCIKDCLNKHFCKYHNVLKYNNWVIKIFQINYVILYESETMRTVEMVLQRGRIEKRRKMGVAVNLTKVYCNHFCKCHNSPQYKYDMLI